LVLPAAAFVLLILQYAIIAVAVFAFVHAVRQRADAFTVVDKLTKSKWLGIIGASALTELLFGAVSFLGIIGVVAVFVYLADVRPKVDEVQRGSRW